MQESVMELKPNEGEEDYEDGMEWKIYERKP